MLIFEWRDVGIHNVITKLITSVITIISRKMCDKEIQCIPFNAMVSLPKERDRIEDACLEFVVPTNLQVLEFVDTL
jgi:hypothetical protein